MKLLIFTILGVLILSGCSGKKYFEPEKTSSKLDVKIESLSSSIKSFNRTGATLEDGRYINNNGISKDSLPNGFEFLNITSKGEVIATNYIDSLLIGKDIIKTKDVVIAASLKDDLLALIYSNNTIELMNIKENKTLFKEYQEISLANDTRIINPYFMGNLILFPTLDGRVVIVSSQTFESVKNISVDPDGKFNNIVFLDIMDSLQTLIVASPNKIVSISTKEILAKDYELRDILVQGENIYIATIDGQIIKLSANLNEIASKKFKYAKIHSLAFSNNLYAIESQGYAIKLDETLNNVEIFTLDFNEEARLINLENRIYNDNFYITLP